MYRILKGYRLEAAPIIYELHTQHTRTFNRTRTASMEVQELTMLGCKVGLRSKTSTKCEANCQRAPRQPRK